jgi:hypothetical protein
MRFKSYLAESYNTLYHVAKTSNIPKIKKEGLVAQKKASWTGMMGQDIRDCKECVYAFTNFDDAVRWAFKSEWDNKPQKFSILTIDGSGNKWDKDTHIEAQMAEGDWVRSKTKVDGSKIKGVQPMSSKLAKALAK